MPSRKEYVVKPTSSANYKVENRATYNSGRLPTSKDIATGQQPASVASGVRANNDIFPTPSGA